MRSVVLLAIGVALAFVSYEPVQAQRPEPPLLIGITPLHQGDTEISGRILGDGQECVGKTVEIYGGYFTSITPPPGVPIIAWGVITPDLTFTVQLSQPLTTDGITAYVMCQTSPLIVAVGAITVPFISPNPQPSCLSEEGLRLWD
jgi:hypothetical protein